MTSYGKADDLSELALAGIHLASEAMPEAAKYMVVVWDRKGGISYASSTTIDSGAVDLPKEVVAFIEAFRADVPDSKAVLYPPGTPIMPLLRPKPKPRKRTR